MGKFVLRTFGNFDGDLNSRETAISVMSESVAQQQFAEECDINTIVKRFGLTGELPENPRLPLSGDFTGIGDFQSAMNVVRAAEEAFMEFPAELRAEFGNDPGRMLEFVHNEKNRDKAIELGLIAKPAEQARDGGVVVPVVSAGAVVGVTPAP